MIASQVTLFQTTWFLPHARTRETCSTAMRHGTTPALVLRAARHVLRQRHKPHKQTIISISSAKAVMWRYRGPRHGLSRGGSSTQGESPLECRYRLHGGHQQGQTSGFAVHPSCARGFQHTWCHSLCVPGPFEGIPYRWTRLLL
jgi:hypothetical protein